MIKRHLSLQVDKPAMFSVNFNGAQGTLKGYVDTPSGAQDELLIQEIDNDLNSCRFLPHENGVYYVHVKFNNAHIPNSPFAMLVGKLGADPALVVAQGDGLQSGTTGTLSLSSPVEHGIVTKGSSTLASKSKLTVGRRDAVDFCRQHLSLIHI